MFLVVGGRSVSATENALINALKLPLAVAWVWVCFDEVRPSTGFVSGITVLAAVVAHVWYRNRAQIVSAAD